MNTPTNIIGLVKELQRQKQNGHGRSSFAKKLWEENVMNYFLTIAQALEIAVEALEDSANMPEHDQDDSHRLRDKAKMALSRINSLPTE